MKIMFNMMNSVWLGIVLACSIVMFPLSPCHASEKQLNLDFDTSDPVEYRARIMEINPDKAQLVVAEETILVVDFMNGAHRFATEVTDDAGNSKPFASFQRGDIFVIKGFKNADGYVFASLVQKVEIRKVKPRKEILPKK